MRNGQTTRVAELTAALQSVLPMAERFSAFDSVAEMEEAKQVLDAAQNVLEGGTEFHLPGIMRRLLDSPDLEFGDLDPSTVEAMNDAEMALAVMPEMSALPDRPFAMGHILFALDAHSGTGHTMSAVFDLVAKRLEEGRTCPEPMLAGAMRDFAQAIRAWHSAHEARRAELPR